MTRSQAQTAVKTMSPARRAGLLLRGVPALQEKFNLPPVDAQVVYDWAMQKFRKP